MKRLFTNIKMISQNTVFLAALASVVSGQLCVPETLDCNEVLPTIYKMGDGSCACDSKAHDGALKYSNGKLFLCLNSEWKALRMTGVQEYGTELNAGSSCKDILEKADGKHLSDGVYWIGIGLSESPLSTSFPVYCDMKNKGWTMVFKALSGIAKDPWKVFSSEFTSGEIDMKGLDLTNNFRKHYKSRIIMFWESFGPAQARMTFHKDGSVRKALTFNAQYSNFESWFRYGKLTESSWSDLFSFEEVGVFSLKGPCNSEGRCQNLLVNKYVERPDCDNVFGWIFRGTYDHCNWEANTLHDIVYCNGTTICHFKRQEDMEVADFAAVFITRRK
ncbi:PREDICTED: uncharacterized protein LOC107342580 isoform X2 [Acropora digitifera]|uniref:uncharacterized protein LOC107342580 isoform X2 n=1 Tax=Acropora digitifera TaxID=70779 RepID=UPI00077B0A50|nr:PREDICTED: uncharacterized protein LOC107342580 isoform X2 [Acropora digitifera]